MSRVVYGVWSEWDLGQQGSLFATKEAAKAYAEKCYDTQNWDEGETFEDIWGDLMGLEEYKLYE